MHQERVVIQPGPIFYEVFAGLLKAQGGSVTAWAERHGVTGTNLKIMATGASNGPKSKKLRQLMLEEFDRSVFQTVYERRVRKDGMQS